MCQNQKCYKSFIYETIGTDSGEDHEIKCPHCGFVTVSRGRIVDGVNKFNPRRVADFNPYKYGKSRKE
jgi:DNA-directed RNA polymerase subunit RPC12/RpoP